MTKTTFFYNFLISLLFSCKTVPRFFVFFWKFSKFSEKFRKKHQKSRAPGESKKFAANSKLFLKKKVYTFFIFLTKNANFWQNFRHFWNSLFLTFFSLFFAFFRHQRPTPYNAGWTPSGLAEARPRASCGARGRQAARARRRLGRGKEERADARGIEQARCEAW